MDITFAIGALLVVVGAAIQILGVKIFEFPLSSLLIFIGGAIILFCRKFNEIPTDFRLKRLKFQTFISSILILLSSYLIYINDKRWIMALFIAAIIELVVVFRTPNEKKE
ncbi:MAG: hypothetical protein J6Y37_01505 [Paludibacteraceae bacterium]|nr:hypothetical protein [Paludibacteraceae bacterium]